MIHIHLRRFCQMCGKKTNLKRLKKYSHKHVQLLSFWYFNKNKINFLHLFLSTTAILFAQLFPLKVNEKGKKKDRHTLFVVISLFQYYRFVIYMFQLHTVRVLRIVETNWRLCSVTHMMYWQALVILCT